ncbi:PREDICTED: BTB/POZ domain-containing protein SETH6-like isoform X1 [Camelina sativa]|uniref:BTB/POZ domain-containing protein SETH6-like isoform X1 n=1 Tax=Camelina sativa TaxID=90675 RepID=A0ABM0ZP52_CAMSA|nr:PREDICTED: BTB/POZ domain-containing protein SETH6-like isoform X1 [Camelina sativa]
MGVVTIPESKQSVSGKRAFRPSSSIRHTPQWPVSDVTSDLTIQVGSASFSLHKFPLVSRSGRIRKLVLESKDTNLSLATVPGGSESFELAAKFCYGVGLQFNSSNIAALRCVAHYLEMTEELSEKNLEARTEAYLKDSVFNDISSSISVLHSSERLLPVAEEINLVGRLVNAIAVNACKEQLASGLLKLDQKLGGCVVRLPETEKPKPKPPSDDEWWGRSLPILKLDFFQRVVSAMKSKGLNQDIISDILMSYARKSLQIIREPNLVKPDSDLQRKQRIVLEAVVGLLPTQANKSSIPISFLSTLLKTAIGSGTSVSCRSDLERRISHQLDQAILEDILIPANIGAMYDTDSVQRIFSLFLHLDECDYRDDEDDDDDDDDDGDVVDESAMAMYDFDGPESPKQSSIFKVSKLMDSYLAEVALDSSLPPSKFIALAELLPDHARVVCDGLYRAVDIFLKVHPHMKDSERYRLCKTISCQKLSQDASSHAAQNERLPVQIAVQVLFYEQTRLKNAMTSGGGTAGGSSQSQFFLFPNRSGSGMASGAISPRDNYASVRRENRELRLEVARMRMRLTDLEKDHVSMKKDLVKPSRRRPSYGMFRKLSRGLNKLNAFVLRFRSSQSAAGNGKHTDEKTVSERRFMFQKRRCHSVS